MQWDLGHTGQNVPAPALDESAVKLEALPKEVGVLLLALGTLGLILPGPLGTPALVAGGVVLWPGAFGRVSHWMDRRFPRFSRAGNRQIGRFIVDLERRYPTACR